MTVGFSDIQSITSPHKDQFAFMLRISLIDFYFEIILLPA